MLKAIGEVRRVYEDDGKWYMQMLREIPMLKGYVKEDITTIKLPKEKHKYYKNKVGQTVEVEVDYVGKKIQFLGL